jgi:serine O-acetyltransferase
MNPDSTPGPSSSSPAPSLPAGDVNGNPRDVGFWALVREDFGVHERGWMTQGFWALFVHRLGNWRMGVRPRCLRLPFSLLYRLLFKGSEVFCGIKLSYNVPVGRRLKLEHFGGMILGARSIGDDVTIRQNTTLGIRSRADLNAKPIIEDRVDIGCGAVLLGNIRIGHDSVIGANAVVVKDVPPCSVVVGIPGRVVRTLPPDGPEPNPAELGPQ